MKKTKKPQSKVKKIALKFMVNVHVPNDRIEAVKGYRPMWTDHENFRAWFDHYCPEWIELRFSVLVTDARFNAPDWIAHANGHILRVLPPVKITEDMIEECEEVAEIGELAELPHYASRGERELLAEC